MRKKITKTYQLFDFLRAKQNRIKYFGYLGFNNLGDEALYLAINQLFGDNLINIPGLANKWLYSILDKKTFNTAMLGGGTMICQELKEQGDKTIGLPFKSEFEKTIENVKEYFVFGTGVDESTQALLVDNWLIEWKDILSKAKYVSCRGPRSKAILENIGVKTEIIGDPACSLIKDKNYWNPEGNTVGINVRPYKYNEKIEQQYLKEMILFTQNLVNTGWKVEFIAVSPMDITPTNHIINGLSNYKPVIHKIYHEPEVYFNTVRRYKMFFGVRLHAVILAMCAGVPSVMISYRKKCQDFSESVHMQQYNQDINELSHEKLEEFVELFQTNGQDISNKIYNEFYDLKELQLARAKWLISECTKI